MRRNYLASARTAIWLLLSLLVCRAHAEPLTEDGCSVALAARGNGEPLFKEIPGLSILNWDPAQPLQIPSVTAKITGILCWRSAAKFADNDYVVPLAGLPLYIKTDLADPSRNRTLVLEGIASGFRVRQLEGPALTKAEQSELRQQIKRYKTARGQHRAPFVPNTDTAKSIN